MDKRYRKRKIKNHKLIQNSRIVLFDHFFYWISYTTTFVSIIILLILAYQGFFKKDKKVKAIFYQLLTIFSISAILSLILKYTIHRPRPFVTHFDILKLSEGENYSFHSGHTTEAFGAIIIFQNKLWAIPIIIWAIFVAYSRKVLGVHYPTDIIVAIIIALIISLITK